MRIGKIMQILITGSKGFIGRNLIAELRNRGYFNINEITRETKAKQYDKYCLSANLVFHLLGVNRTDNEDDFIKGNYIETKKLIDMLKKHNNKSTILYASSIQAELDNPYGKSKLMAEELLIDYAKKYGVNVYIYRLPNVFGKWSKPDYNSVISTFCYRIARDMPIELHDPDAELKLTYIDDVINEFIDKTQKYTAQIYIAEICNIKIYTTKKYISTKNVIDVHTSKYIRNDSVVNETTDNELTNDDHYRYIIPITYQVRLEDIVNILRGFHEMRKKRQAPDVSDIFIRELYSTFISYLPQDDFSQKLVKNSDDRGSFIELLQFIKHGQISVNIIKPGMKKGGHWHQTKNEKFFIIQGYGIITFKRVSDDNTIVYNVNSDNPEAVDIPPGYMHTIINQSDMDMIVIIWADEIYNPEQPDTYQ